MRENRSNNKVLLLTSVASMIQQFNMRNIQILQRLGYQVEVACNFEAGNTCPEEQVRLLQDTLQEWHVEWHQIDFARNVFHLSQNQKAYRQLKTLIKTKDYRFIHCQSPIGGVLGRMAAHACRMKTIYTAHGFHFYKGAPARNWMMFYPVELFLSRWTDTLITINREDYELAARKMHASEIEYIPGIGVDARGSVRNREICAKKREELGIPEDSFLVTSVAEFTPNKNQITVIKAMEQLQDKNIYFLMCGIGERKSDLEIYVEERGLQHIRFGGFREDIHEILQASDCFVLSSLREGLSAALMEAMAESLPIICSRIRGNVDLVTHGREGFLVDASDVSGYRDAIVTMDEQKKTDPDKFYEMGHASHSKIQEFGSDRVDVLMERIYRRYGDL